MIVPRGLTSWLLLTCIFLGFALFSPLAWPNIIIITANVATLVSIGWLILWIAKIEKLSMKFLILAVTALIAISWVINVYSLFTSEKSETVLGPTPAQFIGSLLSLILLAFTTFATIKFHLGEKPPTSDE
jgi:hypothetical protein